MSFVISITTFERFTPLDPQKSINRGKNLILRVRSAKGNWQHQRKPTSMLLICLKSARLKMSQVNEDQIEQWRIESDERRKHLRQLEKETELIKDKSTILDPRVIKEKEEEILREIEMEQQEQRRREVKINLSINQQKEDVKTKR